jgi:hypothetical protein
MNTALLLGFVSCIIVVVIAIIIYFVLKAKSDTDTQKAQDAMIKEEQSAKLVKDTPVPFTKTAIVNSNIQKCNDETAFYVSTNPGSSWENYIKYGVSLGQTWSGSGCPALYPGVEKAAQDAKLAQDKQKCNDETAFYVSTNPGSSWENYIKWGIAEGQTWSGPGCPALYPGQEQAARDLAKKK